MNGYSVKIYTNILKETLCNHLFQIKIFSEWVREGNANEFWEIIVEMCKMLKIAIPQRFR